MVNSSKLRASILSSRAWLLTPKAVSHREISEGMTCADETEHETNELVVQHKESGKE